MFGPSSEINHWFCKAAGAGRIEAMEVLYEQDLADQIARSLLLAARNGHLNAVQWIFAHYSVAEKDKLDLIAEEAAKFGHLEIVKHLSTVGSRASRRASWSTKVMDLAAEHGHLDVVRWLHNNRAEGCSTQAMDGAAANGHLKVVQWLHDHRSEGCTTAAMDGAALQGHLHVLKWLFRHRSEGCTRKAAIDAAEHGHLPAVAWLRDHFPELVPSQQNMVIFPWKQFEMILFLHETHPDIFCPENWDRPLFGVVGEPHDEPVKTWLQERYTVISAKGMGE